MTCRSISRSRHWSRSARGSFQREHPRDERVGAFAVPDQPVVRGADERVRGSVRTVRVTRVDATLQARAVRVRRHVSDDYAARSPRPRERPREQRRGGGVRVVLVRWRRGGRRRRRVDPVGVVVPVVVVGVVVVGGGSTESSTTSPLSNKTSRGASVNSLK